MQNTKIEWATVSWNPTRGCSRVSEGCRNCYAERQAYRFSKLGQPYEGLVTLTNGHPQWTGKMRLVEDKLEEPLHWKKPQLIFVNSQSDLFHEDVPFEFIDKVFAIMALCPQHTFQILTKRPERLLGYMAESHPLGIGRVVERFTERMDGVAAWPGWPLPNVWLGVSVEDQKTADERIPLLRQVPAMVRWVSYEPALTGIDFRNHLWYACSICNAPVKVHKSWMTPVCPEHGDVQVHRPVDWIVVGGESGPGARPMRLQWTRDVVAQCKAAVVPVFVKQLGGNIHDDDQNEINRAGFVVHDRKGGDMSEWPTDLRVREYPQ